MSYRDIWVLAFRNLKAGKRNVRKIVLGIGFAFTLVYCFAAIVCFYKDYKNNFQKNYKSSCYYYEYLDSGNPEGGADALIKSAKELAKEYGAAESALIIDLSLKGTDGFLRAEDFAIIINGIKYTPKSFFDRESNYYKNIKGGGYEIELGLYKDNLNVFPKSVYSDGLNYIGKLPSGRGEIMLDDYILHIYGIDNPDGIIGANICLSTHGGNENIICGNYVVSGIFMTDELGKREEKTYHDYHFEHIYINLKAEDEERFSLSGSRRFYFADYDSYLENCKYANELLQIEHDKDSLANGNYYVTEKGTEICVLNWIMRNIGRLLFILAAVIILIILFSLFYIIRFYRMRNFQYMKMLSCIGMDKRDRRRLYNAEMLIMIAGATVVALYLTFIFIMIFDYITNNVLSYGFTINPFLAAGTVILCAAVMWGYKSVISINLRRNRGFYD